MNIPPAKDIKVRTVFDVITPNGVVELQALQFSRGRGPDKFLATIDGTTKKQIVRLAECSVRFVGSEFKGSCSLVMPMDNGTWAVRLEFLAPDEEFWLGMP